MSYTLSYIVSTRNRIQFLQIILPLLFANIQPDEEIIVVDSNSTDGTQDYLNELHSKGKIHKFISEPDKNQAHGWNKAILTRRQGGSTDCYQKDDKEQAKLDERFLAKYKNYSSEQRAKLVIIDGRLFNGAWNAQSVLPYDDLLAFGSWGTFGNCFGSTLAAAKIIFYAKNPAAQKQLYLEAIAHDVFANGYQEVQRPEERD